MNCSKKILQISKPTPKKKKQKKTQKPTPMTVKKTIIMDELFSWNTYTHIVYICTYTQYTYI